MTEPPPAADQLRNAEAAAEEGAEQVEGDRAPEFLDRRIDHIGVLQGGAAGIVVQHVEPAIVPHGAGDGA